MAGTGVPTDRRRRPSVLCNPPADRGRSASPGMPSAPCRAGFNHQPELEPWFCCRAAVELFSGLEQEPGL